MEACFLDGFLHAVSAFFYASFPAPIELGRIESLLLRQPPSQGKVICSIEFWIVTVEKFLLWNILWSHTPLFAHILHHNQFKMGPNEYGTIKSSIVRIFPL